MTSQDGARGAHGARSPRAVDRGAALVDQGELLALVGYNCRRAYLAILPLFLERMAGDGLRPVDFSVLTLLRANPALTQKQLGATLAIAPPNLAVLLDRLQDRGLVVRSRNPADGRSQVLSLTAAGRRLISKARTKAVALEADATSMLTDAERAQLIGLLQKIHLKERNAAKETPT